MKGHEQIVKARMQGYKPEQMVVVDVGDNAMLQRELLKNNETMVTPDVTMHPYVCVDPSESVRTSDWSWSVGLIVHVVGDDDGRCEIACEKLKAAGVQRAFSVLSDGRVIDTAGLMG